jgi:hypothetical protein
MNSMNPIRWLMALFWFTCGPRYFGGDSTSKTDTTTQNYDNRQVITSTTSNLDLSDKSTNTNSNNTTVNNMDGGAIDAMKAVALGSLDYGDSIFDTATLFANNAFSSSLSASQSAFDTAASLQKDALTGARDAYKDASKDTQTAYATGLAGAAAAYADAKGTTNSQKSIIMAVLAVAGLMGLAFLQKKA